MQESVLRVEGAAGSEGNARSESQAQESLSSRKSLLKKARLEVEQGGMVYWTGPSRHRDRDCWCPLFFC